MTGIALAVLALLAVALVLEHRAAERYRYCWRRAAGMIADPAVRAAALEPLQDDEWPVPAAFCSECGGRLRPGERDAATAERVWRARAGIAYQVPRCQRCGDEAAVQAERGVRS